MRSAEAQERLSEASSKVAGRGWILEIRESQALQIRGSVVSSDRLIPKPNRKIVAGTTAIIGRCVRVGGATSPKATINLDAGGTLYIDVSESIAKQLGTRLYETVSIEGHAKWDSESMDIAEFCADQVTPYHRTPLLAGLQALADAAQGRWNDVDAVSFENELRDESGE
jgi:hypothetical protein